MRAKLLDHAIEDLAGLCRLLIQVLLIVLLCVGLGVERGQMTVFDVLGLHGETDVVLLVSVDP